MVQRVKQFIIYGKASGKVIKNISVTSVQLDMYLMDFLLDHHIPVASSCNGEGICQKCIVTVNAQTSLSCQVKVSEFFLKSDIQTLTFSYL